MGHVFCSILCIELQGISEFVQVIYKENAFALARLTRLDDHEWSDPVLRLLFSHVTFELLHLMRYDPGLWVETEVNRVLVLHFLQTLG